MDNYVDNLWVTLINNNDWEVIMEVLKFETKARRASRLRGLDSPEDIGENTNASFEGTHGQYEALRFAFNTLLAVSLEGQTNERIVDNIDSMLEMLEHELIKESKFIDETYGDEEWND